MMCETPACRDPARPCRFATSSAPPSLKRVITRPGAPWVMSPVAALDVQCRDLEGVRYSCHADLSSEHDPWLRSAPPADLDHRGVLLPRLDLEANCSTGVDRPVAVSLEPSRVVHVLPASRLISGASCADARPDVSRAWTEDSLHVLQEPGRHLIASSRRRSRVACSISEWREIRSLTRPTVPRPHTAVAHAAPVWGESGCRLTPHDTTPLPFARTS